MERARLRNVHLTVSAPSQLQRFLFGLELLSSNGFYVLGCGAEE